VFGLRLTKLVVGLKCRLRGVAVVGVLDGLDHVVDLFERLQPPFEDVRAILALCKLVFGRRRTTSRRCST